MYRLGASRAFAFAGFTAMLKSVVVVAELLKRLAEVVVVNALGVPIGLALSVPPAICSTKTEAGLLDGELDMITVAEGTLERSSVPQVAAIGVMIGNPALSVDGLADKVGKDPLVLCYVRRTSTIGTGARIIK